MPKRKKPSLLMTKQQREQFSELELEIMKRLIELEPGESIRKNLGLDQAMYDVLTLRQAFVDEYEIQARSADARKIPKRMERLSTEALDVVRDVMRNAASPAFRLQAALQILDRAGHIKIEKRIQINADAEAIIKHMNQQGPKAIEVESEELEEAQLVELDPVQAAVEVTVNATKDR
jgi:hypothetical protein